MNATTSKTEQLIEAAKATKGLTAPELAEATGQTMQVIRSRIHTLTKAGRLKVIDGTSPRRYKATSKTTRKTKVEEAAH